MVDSRLVISSEASVGKVSQDEQGSEDRGLPEPGAGRECRRLAGGGDRQVSGLPQLTQ